MRKTTNGFTLVELLIVIVVIAVLASISIVTYNGIQQRANNTSVQADLSTAAKLLELHNIDNSRYPSSAELASMENRLSFSKGSYQTASNAVLYCQSSDQLSYALIGKSKSDTSYIVTSSNQTPREYTATFPALASVVCSAVASGLEAELWIHSGTGWTSVVD